MKIVMILIFLKIEVFGAQDHEGIPDEHPSPHTVVSLPLTERTQDIEPSTETQGRHHHILAQSQLVRRYDECSTVFCFIGQKWFLTLAFISGVLAGSFAGISYGSENMNSKHTFELLTLVFTTAASVFHKFSDYAKQSIEEREREYEEIYETAHPSRNS